MENHTEEKYIAAMVLSGVGDSLGYKNGDWEFCHSGEEIHKELKALGGIESIVVKKPSWVVSDDTVMHLATAEAIVSVGRDKDKEKLYCTIAQNYKDCMRDMGNRAPGATCMNGVHMLRPKVNGGYKISFNERGGGCGAAMRAMCIGLRYPRPEDLSELIEVSVESGRMTHHHPTGYLGALAGALFTSFAIQGLPLHTWGARLMDTLPKVLDYVKSSEHKVEENQKHWSYFTDRWSAYLKDRNIVDGESMPMFPKKYGVKDRDKYYKNLSYSGWGGSSGHDAPMIAYDALLAANNNWADLCSRSMFHSGDSDSTGVMAACWYGALFGIEDVPSRNHEFVEYRVRLRYCGIELYKLSCPGDGAKSSAPNVETTVTPDQSEDLPGTETEEDSNQDNQENCSISSGTKIQTTI